VEIVTVIWTACAVVAMTLAVVCGIVWLIERRDLANLMLCILGVATAASAYGELGMMQSATPAEYVEWLRFYFVLVYVALVSQLLFVNYYLGTGRSWLMWAVIVARSGMVLVNFLVRPNFNFSSIVILRQMPLFGDQVSAIGVAVASERQWFAMASIVLWAAYVIDTVIRRWLKGDRESRRKALAVSLGIVVPMLCTSAYTQLLVYGVVQGPVTNVPWFLAALLMMASELGRDFILSSRERLELAELRNRLAQVDRVSVLGQLASTLAHELSQPLAATAANVEAGLAQLEGEKPNLEELRSILNDIGGDDRRAAEIIERMRQLFKRRTIEMQALRVEDIVQDVVSLVRSEATSKHVVLSLSIQPGLPHVLGDRVHLSQVLLNLLMNGIQALQSCPPDARRIVVEARASDVKAEVEIAVRDSGPGIPDGMADEVFKPFFTTKSEGMGMGLALSRTIIEAHGGRLWTDHRVAREGAVFRFTLRRAPSPAYSAQETPHPGSTFEVARQAPV
jgi:signal transduction histidine kinase